MLAAVQKKAPAGRPALFTTSEENPLTSEKNNPFQNQARRRRSSASMPRPPRRGDPGSGMDSTPFAENAVRTISEVVAAVPVRFAQPKYPTAEISAKVCEVYVPVGSSKLVPGLNANQVSANKLAPDRDLLPAVV